MLNAAMRIFPDKFQSFVPQTWFMPEDRNKVTWGGTYISKPSKGAGGQGIKII
jgi:hypothetical protein